MLAGVAVVSLTARPKGSAAWQRIAQLGPLLPEAVDFEAGHADGSHLGELGERLCFAVPVGPSAPAAAIVKKVVHIDLEPEFLAQIDRIVAKSKEVTRDQVIEALILDSLEHFKKHPKKLEALIRSATEKVKREGADAGEKPQRKS